MIAIKYRNKTNFGRIKKKVAQANFKNLGHAGASVRQTAMQSIKRRKGAAQPGQAPHTRRGELKRAILFKVEKEKDRVIVGPVYTRIKRVGMAHEFGTRFRGDRFKKRPFMGPALEVNRNRLPKRWAGSVR